MRKLITDDLIKCVDCNRCIRACPIEGANYVSVIDGQIKVSVNYERCIACGSCINACRHGVRDYEDDTESFINDLKKGAAISLFAAPANRVNGEDSGRLLTWLRNMGVRKIYDVSLGADICTWAHIRLIEKEKPKSVITQPCPAIVSFILHYKHDLLKYLSPVHSPMLCTAIYMKRYERVDDSIAALSPCIAKAHEFEATGYVKYNVTLKKIFQYVRDNNIQLPKESSGFDHAESAFGRLYSMPGGLKENIEFYFGKKLRIDQAEGQDVVYEALDSFAKENAECLPAVFDVLNCPEGCNIGTGMEHNNSRFQTSTIMDKGRQDVLSRYDPELYDKFLQEYDRMLRLDDFMRRYTPIEVKQYSVTEEEIEESFMALNKTTEVHRTFDCRACGCDSCRDMAKVIAMGFNIPDNCVQKLRNDIVGEHDKILDIASSNIKSMDLLKHDISDIINKSGEISSLVSILNDVILKYKNISSEIHSIASHTNMISLNASIEAARAGIHGKTFAVVAGEIQNLANKSQKTVSVSEEISGHATNSITSIKDMVASIAEDIDKAHISISIVYQSLNNIMTTTEERE